MPQKKSDGRLRLSLVALFAAPAALALACGDTIHNDYHTINHYGQGGADGEAGAGVGGEPSKAGSSGQGGGGEGGDDPSGAGMGGEGGAQGGPVRPYPDAPIADTAVDELDLELFNVPGNRFWFAVSDEQLKRMNADARGGDGIYQPGHDGQPRWVDHLFVTTAGGEPRTADFGRVQVSITGDLSRRPWDPNNIPNLDVDLDEFTKGKLIAGFEQLRFSNGQVGSILRERVAHDLYQALGYPAPLATYVWVQSNVWPSDVSIPYTLIEPYGSTFCRRNEQELGGGCANLWHYQGDFAGGDGGPKPGPIDLQPIDPRPIDPGPIDPGGGAVSVFDDPQNCVLEECDKTRAKELEEKVLETAPGEGFQSALADYVDWPVFQRFQCISWVLSVASDTIHAGQNAVLVERADGKFQFLPKALDVSMNARQQVGLRSNYNAIARGCQADKGCWSATLDVCEAVIAEVQELDPPAYLETVWSELDSNGMIRKGDKASYEELTRYFAQRLEQLPTELAKYRDGSDCQLHEVECNGVCVWAEQCIDACVPVKPVPVEPGVVLGAGGAPAGEDVGVAGAPGGGGPIDCPMVFEYQVAR